MIYKNILLYTFIIIIHLFLSLLRIYYNLLYITYIITLFFFYNFFLCGFECCC